MTGTYYEHGSHNVQCDRSGLKVKRSECRMQWDGLLVRKEDWEPRHPQDFVRGKRDRQSPPPGMVSPEAEDVFLDAGDVTQDDL